MRNAYITSGKFAHFGYFYNRQETWKLCKINKKVYKKVPKKFGYFKIKHELRGMLTK
nr:MAG TPA: hypothetical protein [Caudoviricetes sp.]